MTQKRTSENSPLVIIDYDAGNMLSVARAFTHIGARFTITKDAEEISKAEKLILPGVGAFGKAMTDLNQNGLIEPLQRFAQTGRPFLGICLGMQLMMESSEEFGTHQGLGLLKGHVKPIPQTTMVGKTHKIPHIGWNRLIPTAGTSWADSILSDQDDELNLYFVHSFMVVPDNPDNRLADTDYNGRCLCAAVRQGNLYGFQGHPEKSGVTGINILKNFLAL